MAVPLNLGDVVMARLNLNDGESTIYNVLHYKLVLISQTSGTPPAGFVDGLPYLEQLANGLAEEFATPWEQCTSEAMLFEGVSVQRVAIGVRSELVTFNHEVPPEGEIVGDMLPSQDAVTILKRTGQGQRWGMGRFYHCGIPESEQVKGRISGPYMALCQALANRIATTTLQATGPYTLTWKPCLYSTTPPGVLPVVTRISELTSAVVSNNIIKTQRRRRPGKGM